MHVNREIVDQVVAAALVLLTLMVAERPSLKLATLLGAVTGLSMLGNTRLDRRAGALRGLSRVSPAARARNRARLRPRARRRDASSSCRGSIRNEVNVGCFAITTDGRAMWKANNPRTYGLLSSGQWIDNIGQHPPRPPGAGASHARMRPTASTSARSGRIKLHPDECLEMTLLREPRVRLDRATIPGDKAKLAALSAKLLWQPNVFETSGRPGAGTSLDVGRRVVEPLYMWIALRARLRRPLRRAARVRRARAAAARLPDRRCARVRRRDAVSRRLGLPARHPRGGCAAVGRGDGCARDEGHARPPDPRHRRLRAPPADTPAGARRARHRADLRRARRSRLGRGRLLRCARGAGGADRVAARLRPAAARAACADAARRHRAHASRARRRLRRSRRASPRHASRLDEAQRRSVPRRPIPVRRARACRASPIASSRSPTRCTASPSNGSACRRTRSRRSTTASTACPKPGASTRPTTFPHDARVLLAVARLTEQKGIDVAIRALAALPDDTVLVVLGEGPERAAL